MGDRAGLIFPANNTIAKSIDSPTDCPQRLAMSAAYELPFGHGRRYVRSRGLAGLILGGWQASGILKTHLEFHAQGCNLSNTPAFTLANVRIASLTAGDCPFGKLTGSQSAGRQPQFGLKFLW